MKKSNGSTLVEVLIALCLLGIVLPASLETLGTVLMAELKMQEKTHMISSAEWWFNRLTHPVNMTKINAAPLVDRFEKVRFEWETEDLINGAIRVTLFVYGRLPGPPLTINRIY